MRTGFSTSFHLHVWRGKFAAHHEMVSNERKPDEHIWKRAGSLSDGHIKPTWFISSTSL